MTTNTMASVLAAHLLDCVMYIGTGQEYLCICGNRADSHDAHQEEMLAGAGFGDVREAAAKALEDAATLILNLTDSSECWFDHHGGCQAHGYISLEPGETCPQHDAKEWLETHAAAVRGEG